MSETVIECRPECARSVRWSGKDLLILAGWFVPAAVITWGIHEAAHYLTGVGLGYEMWITFNQVGPVKGSLDSELHRILVSMAGPAITWLQGILAFLVVRRTKELWPYAFLFLTVWTRGLAMVVSFMTHPNDEARASLSMGMPMWLIPALSVAFLLALTIVGSRNLKVGWKGNLTAYLAASLVTAAIVFSDQVWFTN